MTSLRERVVSSRIGSIMATGVAVQVLNLVSGPLVARMLGPSGRGLTALVLTFATISATLGTTALSYAISRTVAGTGQAARAVLGEAPRAWMRWSVLPALAAGAGMWLVAGPSPDRLGLALLALGAALMGCWTNVFVGMLQGELAVPRINAVRLATSGAYVAMVVVVFVAFRTDRAVVVATLYTTSLAWGAWLSWLSLARPEAVDLRGSVDRRTVHRFALRSFFTAATPLTLGLDYVVVALVLSAADLGHYAVASSVSTLPIMILAGVGGSLVPRMASLPRSEAIAVMRRWLAAALAVDVVLVAMMQAVVGPAIRILFGHQFVASIPCARVLIVVMAVLALRIVLASAVQAQGRGGRGSLIDLAASGVMVVGIAAGADRWGVEGAAAGYLGGALLAAALLAASLTWTDDHRSDGMPE